MVSVACAHSPVLDHSSCSVRAAGKTKKAKGICSVLVISSRLQRQLLPWLGMELEKPHEQGGWGYRYLKESSFLFLYLG